MDCGKVKHWTKTEAKDVLKRLNKRRGNDKLKDVYYCSDCIAWHTTSLSKATSRSMTRRKNNKNGN